MCSPLRFLWFVSLTLTCIGASSGGSPAHAQERAAEGYAHPAWFADATWLQHHLGDEDLAVVALTPAEAFAAGHIPGAAQIAWKSLEIVETSDGALADWRTDVEGMLTDLGIERGGTVVVYDGGTFYAPRLWWILAQLGHDDVRLLNGGLAAWVAAGGALETGETAVAPAAAPYAGEPNDDVLVQIAEAEAALGQDGTIFVDARTPEEYAAGHIPGAVNVPFLTNAEAAGPKYWKPAAELRAMYEALGVTDDRRVITYCSSGVRAAVDYLALRQLGYEDVAVFTGSFIEWSSDPARPVTTGDEP